jgi:hypothetical protein
MPFRSPQSLLPESNPALTRNPGRTPFAPQDAERDAYLVLDDFGGDSIALGARPTPKVLIARR